jgi:hypothetical protein
MSQIRRTKRALDVALLGLPVLLGIGCLHSQAYRVASAYERYSAANAVYVEGCLGAAKADPGFCSDFWDSLNDAYQRLEEAGTGLSNGGSISPQIKSLQKALKKAEKYASCRGSSNPACVPGRPTPAPTPAR